MTAKPRKNTGAARQARQRAKGVQVAVILPPAAAADLDEVKLRLECTTKQALTTALHVLLKQLREPAMASTKTEAGGLSEFVL